jgi:hypothetical protein
LRPSVSIVTPTHPAFLIKACIKGAANDTKTVRPDAVIFQKPIGLSSRMALNFAKVAKSQNARRVLLTLLLFKTYANAANIHFLLDFRFHFKTQT